MYINYQIHLLFVIAMPAKGTDNHLATIQVVVHSSVKVIHWPNEMTISCTLLGVYTTSIIEASIFPSVIMITVNSSDVIIGSAQCCYWIVKWIDVTGLVTVNSVSEVISEAIAVYPIFSSIAVTSRHTIYGLSRRTWKRVACIVSTAGLTCSLSNNRGC